MHDMRTLAVGFFLLTIVSVACASSNNLSEKFITIHHLNEPNTEETEPVVSACSYGAENTLDECAPPVQPPLGELSAPHLSQEERTIYLGFNQTSLTSDMKKKLDSLAASLTSEQNVIAVRIIGYADEIGDPVLNEKLSEERAENVRRYLVSQGLTKARVADTRWLGSGLPSTDCADNLPRSQRIDCTQQDRRVDIEIDYKNKTQASR